jgi:hypothetical protein
MMDTETGNDPNYVRVQTWGLGKKQPILFRDGAALFVPKGYYLILETHYMGTGRKESERTTIEFYGDYEPKGSRAIHTIMVGSVKIKIPPNEKRFVVKSRAFKFHEESEVTAFLGHLHMRGRSLKAIQILPNGEERVIMSIPNFYYGWQTGVGLLPDPPVRLAKGSSVRVECEYDNSALNPNNPDPNKTVMFGQTHDRTEMCKVNVQFRHADAEARTQL